MIDDTKMFSRFDPERLPVGRFDWTEEFAVQYLANLVRVVISRDLAGICKPVDDDVHLAVDVCSRAVMSACVYCGNVSSEHEADHIMPRSRGGLDVAENLCPACWQCNRIKSDMLVGTFRARLAGMVGHEPVFLADTKAHARLRAMSCWEPVDFNGVCFDRSTLL